MIISEVGANKVQQSETVDDHKENCFQDTQDSCTFELTVIVITCRNTQTQVLTVETTRIN